MSYYDNHAEPCDGTECVTYECQLLNRDESPEVTAVVELWNREGGWLPGAVYVQLAEVLGVDPDRLTHYKPGIGRHYPAARPDHQHEAWQIRDEGTGPYCAACGQHVKPINGGK